MCLQSKWIFPRKAAKDIVCYKILTKDNNGYLITPYQNFPIGNIKELPIIVEGGKCKSIKQYIKRIKYLYKYSYKYSKKNTVYLIMAELKCKEGGYIHAFTGLCSTTWVVKTSRPYYGNYIIVKCIIPKGTPYHISLGGREICARKMIILKEII
jgi:hypothetical protein